MPYGQLTTLKLVCALRAYPPLDGLLDPDKVSSPFLFVSLSVSCIGFLVFALHLYPPLDGLCGFFGPSSLSLDALLRSGVDTGYRFPQGRNTRAGSWLDIAGGNPRRRKIRGHPVFPL